jgi:endo-beta-N-acetylglucosaminidase D
MNKTYIHQLSATVQEYPENVLENIPLGSKKSLISPFRLISLSEANKSKFTVLVPSGDSIIAQNIPNYSTEKSKKSHLWRFIQIDTAGNFGNNLLQHMKSGKYLCVPEGSLVPKCYNYETLSPERYIWMVQKRSLFFKDPNLKYLSYTRDNVGKITYTDSQTIKEHDNCKDNCSDINSDYPVSGTPYMNLDSDMKVTMSGVKRSSYFKPGQHYAWWNHNDPDSPINDIENEWYPIEHRGDTGMEPAPSTEPLGLGLLKNWKAGGTYSSKFQKCNVPLKARIIDPLTQTKPEQTQYPSVMFGFTSSASEIYMETISGGFETENFEYWQYLDIYMGIAYMQGWPAPELQNLKIPDGLGINPTTDNLFDVFDGFESQSGSGIFSAPNKSLIETAHRNGCKFFGVLFFQQLLYGGKWSWWTNFLKNRKKFAEQLVDYADYHGIDGYFINFEAEGPSGQRDIEGTSCDMFTDKCKIDNCKSYWCTYTKGGGGNCESKDCTLGKWTDNGNVGLDGSDINKKYFIEFLKYFREYREMKNVKVETCMYASLGFGGSSGNYSSGITDYFLDFWIDPVTKQPVVDKMLSMPPNGSINPNDLGYTYAHTSEALESCILKEKFGWPKNTGPTDGLCLASNFSCSKNTGIDCDCKEQDCGDKDKCLSNSGCNFDDSKPTDKPWCFKNGCKDDITIQTNDCIKGYFSPKSHADVESTCVALAGEPGYESCKWDGEKCFADKDIFTIGEKGNNICSNNIEGLGQGQCGPISKLDSLIPKNRAYDFHMGTTAANGFDDFTTKMWPENAYCGTFSECDNYLKGVQPPLSSLFVWQANITKFDSNSSYKKNEELSRKLYIGKTGLCNKNLIVNTFKDFYKNNATLMGMSNFVSERSTIYEVPFYTSFCTGNGENFYINGVPQLYFGSWNDGIQDYLPTWRWWSKQMSSQNLDGNYIESKILSIDYSTSYYGGSCLKVESKLGMLNTDFYLYKTKLSTNTDLNMSVTAKCDSNCSEISIGYTLASDGYLVNNPEIYYFQLGNLSTNWKSFDFKIDSRQGDYISSICLKTLSPTTGNYIAYIGELSIDSVYSNIPKTPKITQVRSFKQNSGMINKTVIWSQSPEVASYNIYLGNYLVGRTYGSCSKTLVKNHDICYNIQNINSSSADISVEAVGLNGKRKVANSTQKIFNVVSLIGLIIFFIFIAIFLGKSLNKSKFLQWALFLIVIVIIIYLITMIGKSSKRLSGNIDLKTSVLPGHTGHLSEKPFFQIENWQDCKKKAFNINFDDNRPKTWTWLLTHLKKKNLPVKVTFFINTNWLDRDIQKYKEWIRDYDVDYGAHGHWHINHSKDNFVSSPAQKDRQCWGDQSSQTDCCDTNSDVCVTDQQLADNDAECARHIRELIYNDIKKELVYAYPYGAYPIDEENNPKMKSMMSLKNNFLAARGVQWGQVKEFPDINYPKSLECTCSNYQGQPSGCNSYKGGCSSPEGCDMSENNVYNEIIGNNIGPEYSWPAGIDLNLDPDCEDCSILDQMEIRKKSLINLLNSEESTAIMVWGHDFHPTDDNGITWPCDGTSTLGGCKDNKACKDNAKLMFNNTGNSAWLTSENEYKCDKGIVMKDNSCDINCVRGKVDENGNCTDENVFGINGELAWNNPNMVYPIESVKQHETSCDKCADSCWNPSIGSKLLEMLELLEDHKDDIWFTHFVSIVQYLWNRKFTNIEYTGVSGKKVMFDLSSTNIMRNIPITVSFRYYKQINNITVDGRKVDKYLSTDGNKSYIKFKPNDNYVHKIVVNYT